MRLLKRILIGELTLRRCIASPIIVLLAVYCFFCLYGAFFADRMIFLPRSSSYTDDADIVKVTTADGTTISVQYLENDSASRTVIFSHGNAEDLGDIRSFCERIRNMGLAVVAYDYPGYGTSEGRATTRGAYAAIDAVFEYLTEEKGIQSDSIVLWGRSVGGAPSVDLASREDVAGIILESTMTSAYRVVTRVRLFPFDRLRNLSKIDRVGCPLLIVHGRRDRVVPFSHGKMLYDRAREPKDHLWVDDAGHNDLELAGAEDYWNAVRDFLFDEEPVGPES